MSTNNKIVLDLDGVLAEIDTSLEYKDRRVSKDIVHATNNAINEGFDISIFSARNMRTYNEDLNKINKYTKPIVESWLKENDINYNNLVLGKVWNGPNGYYVDDNNIHVEEYLFRFSGPLQKYQFDVVIPFYNEEGNIDIVYKNILKAKRLIRVKKIVMIDNGSTDNTREILIRLAKQDKDICLVELDENKGYGHGMKSGMKKCNSDYLITLHGDNQFRLYEYLLVNIDNIINHFSCGSSIFSIRNGRTYKEFIVTFQLILIISVIFCTKVREFNGQPKIIPREILGDIDKLPNDYTIDMNLWYLCKEGKIMYMNNIQYPRESGKSSWGGLNSLRILFSYIKKALYLKYVG